jgi:hypothetical protein
MCKKYSQLTIKERYTIVYFKQENRKNMVHYGNTYKSKELTMK